MAWNDKYVSAAAGGGGDGSVGLPWTLAEAISNAAAGMRINVKAGTYANGASTLTASTAGTTAAQIAWRGYTTTAGDLDTPPTAQRVNGTDIPLLTFTTGQWRITGAFQIFSHIAFSGTTNEEPVDITGGQPTFHRCRFYNSYSNANARCVMMSTAAVEFHFSECYFENSGGTQNAAVTSQATGRFVGCVFSGGNPSIAATSTFSQVPIVGCLFISPAGDAVTAGFGAQITLENCTIYSPLGHGLQFTGAPARDNSVRNCIFHTVNQAGKYPVYNAGAANGQVFRARNCCWNCTFDDDSGGWADFTAFDKVTEAADPLTDAAGGDFSVKATANCKAAGSPGLLEGMATAATSYLDIGAVQRQEAGGSAGGLLVHPGMSGGARG